MQTIKLHARSEADGTLNLHVPVGLVNTELEIVLVVQPLLAPASTAPPAPDWPNGFFEGTYGSFRDTPLERPAQGEAEERDPLP